MARTARCLRPPRESATSVLCHLQRTQHGEVHSADLTRSVQPFARELRGEVRILPTCEEELMPD